MGIVKIHSLGFPRIGSKRELKYALESYWKGKSTEVELNLVAQSLRAENWQFQKKCDYVPVGDFSLYDQVLDTSFLLGNIPKPVADLGGNELDSYFRVARGRSANDENCQRVKASEMTKWFDTNYHYIVPELNIESEFKLNSRRFLEQLKEAQALNVNVKPVFIGPMTYLWLSKTKDNTDRLLLLERLIPVYKRLLQVLFENNVTWVQFDEPVLVTQLDDHWREAFRKSYNELQSKNIKILMATYFGQLEDNLSLACELPVAGLHIDVVSAPNEVAQIVDQLPNEKVLSMGVISGRNVWKADLNAILDLLEPIAEKLSSRLWLAPSCSLLHVPVDLDNEEIFDNEIKNWLAFAKQKLEELQTLQAALNGGRDSVKMKLDKNQESNHCRKISKRVHNSQVKAIVNKVLPITCIRKSEFQERSIKQKKILQLPIFPTTTIGSFPQTQEIRLVRKLFKNGEMDIIDYEEKMKAEIKYSIEKQELLELDVLVHGEAERNDMVEYFGEQLDGFLFSQFGWVQSYGSRCVKPPILFGDISRPRTMTVKWSQYAQSLTDKPVKGMLTGPVTMLNWSFVRDDQPRKDTCLQLALAVREEVLDLENAGIKIIQIDEAALREGLPLRRKQWAKYLDWAVECFRVCANSVKDETQIHTHMCYSEFNDIMESIAQMDADVITIETSRSNMELLDVFDQFSYPNEMGPGVYDIHSPNIPTVEQVIELMSKAAKRIPVEKLWINPDCGLKTRQWEEVIPALKNMVSAAQRLRQFY